MHAPLGGQGLNLGVQDAVNLGFKLAWEVRGWAPPNLLDTYEGERRPVAARVLRNTRAQSELLQTTPGAVAARDLLAELAELDEVNRVLIEAVSGIGIRYDLGDADAPVGRRLRDVPVAGGRLYEHLRTGRGVLLESRGDLSPHGYESRLVRVPASADVVGDVIGHRAALLRPDGHIVWAGDDAKGLDGALRRWFGVPDDER